MNSLRMAGRFLLTLAFCAALGSAFAAEEKKPEIKGSTLLVAPAGQKTTLTLYGENLDTKTVTADKPALKAKLLEAKTNETSKDQLGSRKVTVEVETAAACPSGPYELTLANADGKSVKVPLAVIESGAFVPAKKPCADFAQAMPLTGASAAIAGTMEKNAPQVFRFEAKTGERISVTLFSRHLGYGLDAVLRLRDSRHTSLSLAAGSAKKDRQIDFHAPADGVYYLELTDAEGHGGETFEYRLLLSRKVN